MKVSYFAFMAAAMWACCGCSSEKSGVAVRNDAAIVRHAHAAEHDVVAFNSVPGIDGCSAKRCWNR